MNETDFSSTPIIGSIMNLTGINDGWIVICLAFVVLSIILLVGWISSASKIRLYRKELSSLKEEITGLQALTNLPPLHEGGWEYAEGADPGSSLVFASAKEIRRRRGAIKSEVQSAPEDSNAVEPSDNTAKDRNVTAQVHDAIFASVAGAHEQLSKNIKAQEDDKVGNRKRKANGAAITSSDLPPIHVGDSKNNAPAEPAKKAVVDTDASLSSRIPRL